MCFKIKPKVKTKPEIITKRPVIINRTYAMHQLKKSLFEWCTIGTDDKQIKIFRKKKWNANPSFQEKANRFPEIKTVY
jgi:hypothetical protein